jgi:D-aminopeptidase
LRADFNMTALKEDQSMTRLRDLGDIRDAFPPGTHNSITDVPGVRVGHATINDGAEIHTGVTAIVPDRLPLPAGLFVGNGYGKLVGATQLVELGEIETPILLTGTLSAFRVADALVSYMLALPGNEEMISVNPVVGETNDGFLSDIRSRSITEADVLQAIDSASDGPVAEGCVGAGTGTSALGFKAGIGTSSRVVGDHTIGALVQANFGGSFIVKGYPVPTPGSDDVKQGNSCMIVVATDAPLDARQLGRLATRAVFAMSLVGASFSHGSGDYAITFSTKTGSPLRDNALDPLFFAVQDAVEEALLNSLVAAKTTIGYRGRTRHAVSHDAIREALARAQGLIRATPG